MAVVPLSALAIALLGLTALALAAAARHLLGIRRTSAANALHAPGAPDLLQLPPLRRRSRDADYQCTAYLDGSEGGFVDAVRRWRTRVVLGKGSSADATVVADVARDTDNTRARGLLVLIGIGPDAPTRIAAMNLALALGQLSRTLYVDVSGVGTAAPVQPSDAPSGLSVADDAPVYWPGGMIHRLSLPQFKGEDPAERWAGLAEAHQQFDWVVLDAGGSFPSAELLGGVFPASAVVSLVGRPDAPGLNAAWEACRSALADPRQLDCVVVVN